jgi:predicted amidophosphoribosyltransferase
MILNTTSLVRVRPTHQQAKTSNRAQRRDNMSGAFAVQDTHAILDRDIVLIDDICTTGATLDECAHALKEAGARTVSAIVVAHG